MKDFLKVEDDVLYFAVQEFGRDKNSFDQDVETVRKWLKEQPHLLEVLEKRCLQNFLLLNKCSIERTKQKIDMYFTVRSNLGELFEGVNPKLDHMKKVREMGYWVIHPTTFQNNRLLFFKMRQPQMVEKFNPNDALGHLLNIQEIRMKEDVACGEYFIADCKDFSVSFVFKLTPTFIYKALVVIYEKVYSSRLKGVYVINLPKYAEAVLNIAKKIMKPKLFERIKICTDFESLKETFPEELLPADFGGVGYTLEQLREMLEEKIVEYQPWFDHLDTLKTNEKLRPENLKNDDILGFHGNFKKLDVD